MGSDFAPYRRASQRAWLLTIIDTYREICRTHKALNKLALPNFVLNDQLTATLGRWDASTRTITLAATMYNRATWHDVQLVLKHEIAHQVVSEIFGVQGDTPHGQHFQRACAILGISAAARHRLAVPSKSDASRLSDRIRKLLALGQSPNKHESERALAKARELSIKYNLREHTPRTPADYALRPLGPLYKRVPSFIWYITAILTEHYFVRYICRPQGAAEADGTNGDVRRVIELYGTLDNLDLAEYIYYYLLHEGERLWYVYRIDNRLRNNRLRLSFLKGLYSGFRNKLDTERQQQQNTAEAALVQRGDPALHTFFRERNPRVSRRQTKNRVDRASHHAGYQTGQSLNIRPGVTSGGVAAPPLLLPHHE